MKVSDAMNRDVRIAAPEDTIRSVAKLMGDHDIGFMPVGDDDRLVGTITDRDLAVRAVGEGREGTTPVVDVMTREVKYCFDDQAVDEVARNMAEIQVRRLPVVDRDKRLVGVVALSDTAHRDRAEVAGEALEGISRPGGRHTQAA